jgi:LysM repeat protein
MKLPSLTVKRRPVKKGAFRTYFANIVRSKKQHRASTAAMPAMPEVDGDVPNLGIARALVVILIIHVVAIAGIFAHSHWFEEPRREAEAKAAMAGLEPKKGPRHADTPARRVSEDGQSHLVVAGDTWDSIAAANGVTVEALRAENRNVELGSGIILNVPASTQVAEETPELVQAGEGSVVHEPASLATREPVRHTPAAAPATHDIRGAEMVETTAARNAELVRPNVKLPIETAPRAAEAVVNNPRTQRGTPAATTATTTTAQGAPALANKYTVKQGDTFWKIAQAHKTTPEAVMKANNIRDAKKLRPGMQLRVP